MTDRFGRYYFDAMKRTQPHKEAQGTNFGTAAHEDLLSKTPGAVEEFRKEQAKYRNRLAELKEELEQMASRDDAFSGCLNRLEKAGAHRDRVLHVLTIEISAEQKGDQLREMRRTCRNMKSLAKRLQSMADELENVYADPTTYPDLFLVALQIDREGPVTPASERIPQETIDGMRDCARDLRARADEFGRTFKSLSPPLARRPIEELLADVYRATGDSRQHLHALADVLHAVYEHFGITKGVSKESLEKLFVRHVVPRLLSR